MQCRATASATLPVQTASQAVGLAANIHAGYNLPMPSVSPTVRVKVLFFGRLREIAGQAEESVDILADASIESLFAHFAAKHPLLKQYRSSVVASRNQEFAAWDTPLGQGDEVAFLPPVSGG
jgi:sulfur-carrier protein